jgi:hypothetical protein
MNKEDYTHVIKKGAFDNGRGERKNPEVKQNYKAFVKRAVAFNNTGVTKRIRIGVLSGGATFMKLGDFRELDKSETCEVIDIRLLEHECIAAYYEGTQIKDELILRVEGEQYE